MWFLLNEKKPLSAAENMARDEYLFLRCHEKKMGFFRLYSWKKPSFSVGVSQKISRAIDENFINNNNCSCVRRITGGKTVLHNDEITYAVISSEDIFYRDNDLHRSYMLISTILLNAFTALGLNAYLSKGGHSHLSKSNNPCFSFPTPHELEIQGKKIVGSAQKRNKQALLQHGSIPISMNYDLYAQGTRTPAKIIKRNMTTFNEVSDKTKNDLNLALVESFQTFIRQPLAEFDFDREEKESIAEIQRKYNSKEWTYRL
jgi:lipoate-protein ligase A